MNGTDKALSEILSRFGQSAPELWTLLVAAQRFEAIVFGALFVVMLVAGFFVLRKIAEEPNGEPGLLWIGGGFVVLIISGLTAIIVCEIASSIVYPEAAAVQSLVPQRH